LKPTLDPCGHQKRYDAARNNLEAVSAIQPADKNAILSFVRELLLNNISKARATKYLFHLTVLARNKKPTFNDCTRQDIEDLVDWLNSQPYTDIFGKHGLEWLRKLDLPPTDRTLLEVNLEQVTSLNHSIDRLTETIAISAITNLTNPVDPMTYLAHKKSGFERNRIFGMSGILDTLRYRSYVALELNVSREDIRALVIGEHGDHMIPLVDYTTVAGIPLRNLLDAKSIQRIAERTRTGGRM
jgi:hypothetical protein